MDLKWIQTFIIAAKHENFRKASEELFISQPSVTMHIKLLENYAGAKLFERVGRKVLLTEEGRWFLPLAHDILETHKKGMQDWENLKQGVSRKLTIAISPLIASSIMPYIVKKYMSINPELTIDILVLESREIAQALLTGNADCGLTRLKVTHPELTAISLYEDPVVLVCAHDGWDSETSPPVDIETLLTENRILTYNHPEYWDKLLSDLRKNYPAIRTMVVSQVHVTKRFIEEGLGVSFLPRSTIRRELMEGRLMEARTDQLSLPVSHTYYLTKYHHSEGEKFLEFLNEFNYK
ncbi:LysR family transcriptional regulator [Peribacillus sp. SCS-155]|uniref:LysR family transcriptional regulator n=1 Tax=Peribacillus sedimenti TaxID=3115297 RepID=UPI00390601C4